MATDLGKAYVQIVPSAKGISGSISNLLSGESSNAGRNAGNNIVGQLVSTVKKMIPAAAIGKLIYDSIQSGAKLEQSYIGGLDTLYGEAADRMRECATLAAEAGISANDFAEQAVSFGAALKQSFGDAEDAEARAGKAANLAILDMADNAAKMGTSLESIQNAYQGFAKQNYTMLDNLKLGYGGTKSEMQRLLKDAQKLTGVKYDINNLADVYVAIHAIQEDLGIAGVAAEEAKTTISGSFNAMKAAAQNFTGALALGENVQPALETLISSVSTFLFDNLIPAVVNVVSQLPGAIFNVFEGSGSEFAAKGLETIQNLAVGFAEGFPEMMSKVADLIIGLTQAIWDHRGEILDIGKNIILGLIEGLWAVAEKLWAALIDIVKAGFSKVKNWLGIESPSKRFRYIGLMTGEGLAEGLYDSTGMVQDAMNSLMNPFNSPLVNGGTLAFASGPAAGGLSVTFNIDNSGKDITDDDLVRWTRKIFPIIDEEFGRRV